MINNFTGVGRLTKDPKTRDVNGDTVANFTIAMNRTFTNKQGEREADFLPVVSWRNADFVGNYLTKGSLVGITGRIQTRNYENKEGQRVFITELVADSVQGLESKKERERNGPPNNRQKSSNSSFSNEAVNSTKGSQDDDAIDIQDDDLPF